MTRQRVRCFSLNRDRRVRADCDGQRVAGAAGHAAEAVQRLFTAQQQGNNVRTTCEKRSVPRAGCVLFDPLTLLVHSQLHGSTSYLVMLRVHLLVQRFLLPTREHRHPYVSVETVVSVQF